MWLFEQDLHNFATVQSNHSLIEQGGVTETVYTEFLSSKHFNFGASGQVFTHWSKIIMQFLRIAGDDAEKTKKKRTPKVQKVRTSVLFIFCVWLPHKYYSAEVYILAGRLFV